MKVYIQQQNLMDCESGGSQALSNNPTIVMRSTSVACEFEAAHVHVSDVIGIGGAIMSIEF